ncbi:MAG: META domain-containing protein [Alteraurantiacibacter sp. bin_em_oilr2.035]|nr:META domain-containing protein [Alteraurantiacibacter sp. bin_em_oilr2.035]
MSRHLVVAAAAMAMSLSACATLPPETGASDPVMVKTIDGTLSYRERIALPPDAMMEIVVSDITYGSERELVLSRTMRKIGQSSMPIPFTTQVSRAIASDGPLYGLRAYIREPDGTVLFRSSEPFLLNLQSDRIDIGNIVLTMTSPDDAGPLEISGVHDIEWHVTQIAYDVVSTPTAPVLTFGVDNRFYGSTGCNNFSGEYELDGSSIDLDTLAVTRRACEAPLMEQERRFLEVINNLETVSLDQDGRLVLSGADNLRMVAERSR